MGRTKKSDLKKKKLKREVNISLGRKIHEKELKTEIRTLKGFAKQIVEKRIFKEICLVKDLDEKHDLLKYFVKFTLELRIHDLDKKITELKKEKKDVFIAETGLKKLALKVKLFNATLDKKDFNSMVSLLKDVEKEVSVNP